MPGSRIQYTPAGAGGSRLRTQLSIASVWADTGGGVCPCAGNGWNCAVSSGEKYAAIMDNPIQRRRKRNMPIV
jgi:hypothetical protein